MTLLRASITNISPSRLFILRWAAWLAGANMKAWKTRSRKEKNDPHTEGSESEMVPPDNAYLRSDEG